MAPFVVSIDFNCGCRMLTVITADSRVAAVVAALQQAGSHPHRGEIASVEVSAAGTFCEDFCEEYDL